MAKDPTEAMRLKAGQYAGVDEGTACTQASFKTAKRAFLYCGEQGGRYKAMFKLEASLPEAEKLAEMSPDDYQVGIGGWVTARFSAEQPMPTRRWQKWLEESYQLSLTGTSKSKSVKKSSTTAKRTATKRTTTKRKTRPK